MRSRAGSLRALTAAAALALPTLGSAACAGDGADPGPGAEELISRETFVSTYVDLRVAALRNPDGEIEPGERARLLREHGVTEEQLLRFVEGHFQDAGYMEAVWDDVESRLDSIRTAGDTASS